MTVRLASSQLRERYSGTVAGLFWAVAQPALLMGVYWFVFSFGLRVTTAPGEPSYVSRLLVGLAAWFWFNDAVQVGTAAVTANAFLVKKIAFPLAILPLSAILSTLWVHALVLGLLALGLVWTEGLDVWRLVQLPIYAAGLGVLALGLAYGLSALNVFYRDVAQTTGMVMQLWFWITPLVWTPDVFPMGVRTALQFNPAAYFVEGYRYALLPLNHSGPSFLHGVAYWVVASVVLGCGVELFRRLRGDFADAL